MRLRLRAVAADDLEQISAWLDERSPAAAQRVLDRVFDTLQLIRRHPMIGRPTELSDLRRKVVSRTRYSIYYLLRDEVVDVVAILHAA